MPDCPLGVHDGPKVATLGDQLVNGAGVSSRQRGQSTIGSMLVDTDGRKPKNSRQTLVGRLKTNGRLPVGVHRPSSATGDHESGLGVRFPHGASGRYLVALKIGPTAELEYMPQEPEVVGSTPTGATCDMQRRSSTVEHRKSLIHQLRWSFLKHVPTAGWTTSPLGAVGSNPTSAAFAMNGAVAERQTRVV